MKMKGLLAAGLLAAAVLVTGTSEGALKPLPEAAHVAAEKAEDVIDFFMKGDWKGAGPLVAEMARREADVERLMRENGMPASPVYEFGYLVFRLKELMARERQPIEAALVANQMTALLIDLEGHYARAVPLEVAWMDYLGREVVLLATLPEDHGLLGERVSELEGAWASIREAVKARKGLKTAAKLDRVMAGLKKGAPRAAMKEYGNRVLDLVDELEALFK